MFKISCFADEISADLNEQIEVVKRNKIKYIELRSVWNKNVLDLTDEELHLVKSKLDENGISVSCIGSPIGKVNILDDFDKHMDRFKRAVVEAHYMQTRLVPSFFFMVCSRYLILFVFCFS
jgi:sugar phosphate isomerase/epimerase